MINKKLRLEIYKSNVKQYELAEKLGMERTKLCRLLQRELTPEETDKIFKALKELEKEKVTCRV